MGLIPQTSNALLDLVAVSIAADIVPMVGKNRIMAYHGLRRINSNPNMVCAAIIRICGLTGKEITVSDLNIQDPDRRASNASRRMQKRTRSGWNFLFRVNSGTRLTVPRR